MVRTLEYNTTTQDISMVSQVFLLCGALCLLKHLFSLLSGAKLNSKICVSSKVSSSVETHIWTYFLHLIFFLQVIEEIKPDLSRPCFLPVFSNGNSPLNQIFKLTHFLFLPHTRNEVFVTVAFGCAAEHFCLQSGNASWLDGPELFTFFFQREVNKCFGSKATP